MFVGKKVMEKALRNERKKGREETLKILRVLMSGLVTLLGRAETYKLLVQAFGHPDSCGGRITPDPAIASNRWPRWVDLLPPAEQPKNNPPSQPSRPYNYLQFKMTCPACGKAWLLLDSNGHQATCPECGYAETVWWVVEIACDDPFQVSEWGNPGESSYFSDLQAAERAAKKASALPCPCCGQDPAESVWLTWETGPQYKPF